MTVETAPSSALVVHARMLGVTSVLDGSIRRSGNRPRISVQLVNAADGYQVWSERKAIITVW